MHGDVHDHHALGAEMEGQDLEGVGDQEAGPANVVEAAKEPDEDELSIAGVRVLLVGVIVYGAGDGPADEADHHTCAGCQQWQWERGYGAWGIPQMERRKSGRRPNLSTHRAAAMVTLRSRMVLPVVIYESY